MKKTETKFRTLVEALRERAQRQPDQYAYRFLGDGRALTGSLTYSQLDERARSIAASLQSTAPPGARVLLIYHQGLDYIAAFMACLYAGVIAVPTYPPKRNRPDARLASIVENCAPAVLLTNSNILSDLSLRIENAPQLKNVPWINTDDVNDNADQWRDPNVADDTLAFLQYTSGSTSAPKGVMVSHHNLVHNLLDLDAGWKHDANSVMVSWLPLFHDMGLIYGALEPLLMGFACYLLTPASFLQSPACWLEAISQYGGTHSAAPNFAFDLCVHSVPDEKMSSLDLRSWRMALNAAEPVRDETIRRFQQKFAACGLRPNVVVPGFGLAENTLKVTATHVGDAYQVCHLNSDALGDHRIIDAPAPGVGVQSFASCGPVDDAAQVRIVDPESFKQCAAGRVGEIWTAGRSKALGYWGRGPETRETFAAQMVGAPGQSYLRTGDLGFVRDGRLYVAGRLKDLLIIRGLNHYPQDIEKTVEECHPALRPNCGAAFSVEIDGQEQLVIAQEVERIHRRKTDPGQIIAAVRKALAESHDLQAYAIVLLRTATVPKTSSGKIQRHACKQRFLDGSLYAVSEWRREAVAPASAAVDKSGGDIQQWLQREIAGRTGVNAGQIRLTEPFSSYGLDSAAAAALSGALQQWLQRDVPPTFLYDYPTIEQLANALTAGRSAEVQVLKQPSRQEDNAPIAVIGMACRFPGANNPRQFWALLRDGKSAVREVGPQRWQEFDRSQHPAAKWGGFLDGVDQFDPAFFEITPREAESMDPQQRLLLEVAWEALEDAHYAGGVPTNTGVFVGVSANDYAQVHHAAHAPASIYYGTGTAFSIAANRISYWLNLRGPSMAIDTACSSSLVAVHYACLSLRRGECSLALAGGVNLMLTPFLSMAFESGQMLSPDGQCRAFDAAANGYVRGEGCGVIALKRLSDAQRDGDRVLAVVRGSAVNQDGRSNGLTAPNGPSQREVILRALSQANLSPADIQYLEAHGTGTPLGDPIECNTLSDVLSTAPRNDDCWVGSAKTNIGHLESAAGVAGLIKVVLSLQHRQIPAHLHFNQLNPLIQLSGSRLQVPSAAIKWTASGRRCAGVSSFGFGGANCHLVVSEGGQTAAPDCEIRSHSVLALSARSDAALTELAQRYVDHLDACPADALADICGGANAGRAHFNHRLSVVAASRSELRETLAACARGESSINAHRGESKSQPPQVAFIFTGQGAQTPGMARALFESSPQFRQALLHCDGVLRPALGGSLLDCLYGESSGRIHQTGWAQPALFALSYALCEVWRAWGVRPCAVLGHSVGEYAAACAAGVMSWDDGLRLIAERGRLMQALPPGGGMAALLAPVQQVEELIAPYAGAVSLAALNGPRNTVASGPLALLDELAQRAEAQGVAVRPLQTSHGFHSSLMEPMLDEFESFAQTISYQAPRLPVISNSSGREESQFSAAYWRSHVRQPVRFADGMQSLCALNVDAVVEIGPHPVLLGMAQQCVERSGLDWLPSLRRNEAEWKTLLDSAGRLYVRGANVHWREADAPFVSRKISLPNYPFQRQRYWISDAAAPPATMQNSAALLEQLAASGEFSEEEQRLLPRVVGALHRMNRPQKNHLYEISWREQALPSQPVQFNAPGAWLLISDAGGAAAQIAQRLQAQQQRVSLLPDGGDLETALDELARGAAPLRGVVYCCALDAPPAEALTRDALEQSHGALCASMLHLLQTLARRSHAAPPKVWALVRNAIALPGDDCRVSLAQTPLRGLGKTAALEHPELWGGLIDLGGSTGPGSLDALLREWSQDAHETEIALRQGKRYAARLVKYECEKKREVIIRPDATYWVVGGLGALGLRTAQWLVERGARSIVLSSRRGGTQEVSSNLKALRSQGAGVHVWRGDVCDAAAMREIAQRIGRELPPLKGAVHAAGGLDDATLLNLSPQKMLDLLRPKTCGALGLYEALQSCELDFILFYSSLASVMGSPGQANYCAANSFLDGFAHDLRRRGVNACAINWGPWSDGGMASHLSRQNRERLASRGFNEMAATGALACLPHILNSAAAQVACFDADWPRVSASASTTSQRAFLTECFTACDGERPVAAAKTLRQQLTLLPSAGRAQSALTSIQDIVMSIIGAKDRNAVRFNKGLFEMGMDSLMTVELKNRLQDQFELALPPTIGFEYPTIEALAAYLLEQCFSGPTNKTQKPPADEQGRCSILQMDEQTLEEFIETEFEQWRP